MVRVFLGPVVFDSACPSQRDSHLLPAQHSQVRQSVFEVVEAEHLALVGPEDDDRHTDLALVTAYCLTIVVPHLVRPAPDEECLPTTRLSSMKVNIMLMGETYHISAASLYVEVALSVGRV